MTEPKTIYCPRCGRVACHYDGKQANNPVAKCRKCKKLVVYNVEKDEVLMRDVPKRSQASGTRFY